MKPTSLELTNFKAIGEKVFIPIRPITLIFGQNSSGKSSIMQCLSMLAQSVDIEGLEEPFLRHKGDLIDVGTFRDFIHGHDIKKPFLCKFNFDMDEKQLFDEFLSDLKDEKQLRYVTLTKSAEKFKHILSQFNGLGISFRFEYNVENGRIFCKDVEFFLGDSTVPAFTYNGFKIQAHYEHKFWAFYWIHFSVLFNEFWKKDFTNIAISEVKDEDIIAMLKLFDELPKDFIAAYDSYLDYCIDTNNFISSYSGFLPSHFAYLEPKQFLCSQIFENRDWNSYLDINQFDPFHPLQLIVQVSAHVKKFLQSFQVIGPLRKEPERYLIKDVADNNRTRQSGGNSIMSLLYEPELLDTVNREMKLLQTGYQVKIVQYFAPSDDVSDIYQLQFVNSITGVAASIRDVGFGFSQLLPVIIECVREFATNLFIEQPELHLHPALQTELGDMFLRYALSNKNIIFSKKDKCCFIETHSEHLVLRILRRVRETSDNALEENAPQVFPDQVAVLYVQPDINGSKVVYIPINEDGEFTRLWPKGFFAERGRELF